MAFKDTKPSLKSKLLVLIDLIPNFQLEHFSSRNFIMMYFDGFGDSRPPKNNLHFSSWSSMPILAYVIYFR